MDRDNPQHLDAVRGVIEDAIEALLALLDTIDGDSGLEDDEPNADDEPEGGR